MNLVQMLEKTVNKYPNKTFLVAGERRISYVEINEQANKVANALIQMGLKKGDRVALMSPNRPEFVSVFFGILKAGGIAVALDTRYRIGELARLFANCIPAVLIGESALLEPIVPALSGFSHIRHVIDLDGKYKGKFLTYGEIMAAGSAKPVKVNISPDDLGIISYSGGPTNHPKGAALTHGSLAEEGKIAAQGFEQTDRDIVMLFALPMYHNFALCSVFFASVWAGSTIVIVPGTGISIHTLMEAIEKERGTVWLGVPYIFSLAVKLAEKEGVKNDLSSLRLCASGGAPLRVETVLQFKKYYGLTLADVWGLTESASHVTCMALNGTGKIGTIGRALAGWELKIVDDDGKELPTGQVGEIIVRGPIMKGYYGDPEASAKVLKDGWLYTGDLGKLDSDGYVTFAGVKKELIILKGQNIYAQDIEETISAHPKVAAVKVIGVPDKLRGEVVGAAIVLKPGHTATDAEIKHFCAERVADYKVPRLVVFVPSLPAVSNPGGNWKEVRNQLLPLFMPPELKK